MQKAFEIKLPEELIISAVAYADSVGKSLSDIIQSYLENLTARSANFVYSPPNDETLILYARGIITQKDAMRRLSIDDKHQLTAALSALNLSVSQPEPRVHVGKEGRVLTFPEKKRPPTSDLIDRDK